jgi:hypothetical protein
MRDIKSIINEVINDVNEGRENSVKYRIRDIINNIIYQQDQIATATKEIVKLQESLKILELPITITKEMV